MFMSVSLDLVGNKLSLCSFIKPSKPFNQATIMELALGFDNGRVIFIIGLIELVEYLAAWIQLIRVLLANTVIISHS
jgi:hypothetical protein